MLNAIYFQARISWYCTFSWFSFFATHDHLTYEKGSFEMPVRKDHRNPRHVLSLRSCLRKQHWISTGGLSERPPAYANLHPGRVMRTQIYQSPEKWDVCDVFLLTAWRQCLNDYLTLFFLTNSSQIWPSEEFDKKNHWHLLKHDIKVYPKYTHFWSYLSAFPFPDHLDTFQALGFNSDVKVRLRRVRPRRTSSLSTNTEILSNDNLLFGLEMGKGGMGVGQADDGGEVQIGDDHLQG